MLAHIGRQEQLSSRIVLNERSFSTRSLQVTHGENLENWTSSFIDADQRHTATQTQVFANYYVVDLPIGFISCLGHCLREENIYLFGDEDEVKAADPNNPFVMIEESVVALAIISPNYTNSVGCLEELVKIKECRDKENLKVIPIFYNIEPWDVRCLKGNFGDNWRRLKELYEKNPGKTKQWEEALTSITLTTGISLSKQSDISDEEFIKTIVEKVNKFCRQEQLSSGVTNERVFYVPARALQINHVEYPEKWTWSSIYDDQSETNIEVVTLIKVYFLHISGNFYTRELTPGTRYEVVFIVSLDDTSSGWEQPVTVNLKVQHLDGILQEEHKVSLTDYIGKNWVDIKVGEFEPPPSNSGAKIIFTLHQYADNACKKGLVVKKVAIRPIY